MSELPSKETMTLTPAQRALLGCIRRGPKLRSQLSGLRGATWSKLRKAGLLTIGFDWRANEVKLEITERGKEVYDNE